jgi:WD40 repeat protein
VTASVDKTVQIWDATNGEKWMQLGWNNFPRTCVAFSPDGKRIITGTTAGQVPIYTYDIFGPTEELRRLARARVHRELTPEERQKYLRESPSK